MQVVESITVLLLMTDKEWAFLMGITSQVRHESAFTAKMSQLFLQMQPHQTKKKNAAKNIIFNNLILPVHQFDVFKLPIKKDLKQKKKPGTSANKSFDIILCQLLFRVQ